MIQEKGKRGNKRWMAPFKLSTRGAEQGVESRLGLGHKKTLEIRKNSRVFANESAGTRTQDQRIKSPLLYRLSYTLVYSSSVAGPNL